MRWEPRNSSTRTCPTKRTKYPEVLCVHLVRIFLILNPSISPTSQEYSVAGSKCSLVNELPRRCIFPRWMCQTLFITFALYYAKASGMQVCSSGAMDLLKEKSIICCTFRFGRLKEYKPLAAPATLLASSETHFLIKIDTQVFAVWFLLIGPSELTFHPFKHCLRVTRCFKAFEWSSSSCLISTRRLVPPIVSRYHWNC